MKIAVIGKGNIGSGLEQALKAAGHAAEAFGRDADLGAAVAAAEAVILATPYGAAAEIARAADFSGKLVIDLSNPVSADFSGLAVSGDSSAAEEIAKLMPGATVAKAFNTIFAQHYASGLKIGGAPIQTFVAADDEGARATVKALAESLGLEPVDAGPLKNARYLEAMGFLNIQFGYMLGLGLDIAPRWQAA
ncbi:NADPH-dependent F420 reductase [Poseidonocella sp. HB161398]|uniref:NADPH-dependent F420 reductase n=1 Tax=Poseidonocella sp. HB161398 TaxID=2320855 RepID=UPI001107B14B|nr:F420-dependent NADP oxidoreductase [Poseidonocella sp. HB161398]